MKIFINGKEISVTLEKENNLYDVLKPIEEWCGESRLLINKIIVDKTKELKNGIEEAIGILISNTETVDITALSYSEYAFTLLIDINEYIIKIAEIVPEAISDEDGELISTGILWILDSLPRTLFLLNMKLEDFGILHILKTLEVKKEKLDIVIKSKDMLVDFLKNELKPFLKEKMLTAMEKIIYEADMNALFSLTIGIDKDNALYRTGTIYKFKNTMFNILERVVESLQRGADKEAFLYAEKFSRVFSSISSVLSQVAVIYNIDFSYIKKNDTAFTEAIDNFNAVMKSVLDAFANEDYVSIADILEYEIKPLLENFMEYIPIIENHIEEK